MSEDITENAFDNLSYEDKAVCYLNEQWGNFLASISRAIQRENRYLLSSEKYYATAEKKGKTPKQIAERRRRDRECHDSLVRHEAELRTYTMADKDIKNGVIKPLVISAKRSFYCVPMPNGEFGWFDSKYGIVMKYIIRGS